jgi:competence protein ComEC
MEGLYTVFMKLHSYLVLIAVALLLAATVGIVLLVIPTFAPPHLTVSILDIGQGDSIFIQSPTGRQVLVDGGPSGIVLRRLGEIMPWHDRSIDMIVATHPDSDHVSGLIDVLARYEVRNILQSSVKGDTAVWHRLEDAMHAEGAPIIIAKRGQIFDLGGGAYFEVLFPDRALPDVETNTASIVARVVYGSTSVLLTGDSPKPIEEFLVELDRETLKSTLLKAGHHGSKNSSSPLYLGYVDPQYVVFSRGCNNRYGHPARETVAVLAKFADPTYDTCLQGTVTYVSNGTDVSIRTAK